MADRWNRLQDWPTLLSLLVCVLSKSPTTHQVCIYWYHATFYSCNSLRTSETNYLNEAFSFYAAIRSRGYYSKAAKEERSDLMVKKLRYYARFIVVCLLLKKMKLVRDLVRVSFTSEAAYIIIKLLTFSFDCCCYHFPSGIGQTDRRLYCHIRARWSTWVEFGAQRNTSLHWGAISMVDDSRIMLLITCSLLNCRPTTWLLL